jgi:hypothetical protein
MAICRAAPHHAEGPGPALRGSESLKAQGIETLDLSTIFKDKTQNLFTDGAGHFNSIGNAMVADRLAAAILATTAATQP